MSVLAATSAGRNDNGPSGRGNAATDLSGLASVFRGELLDFIDRQNDSCKFPVA